MKKSLLALLAFVLSLALVGPTMAAAGVDDKNLPYPEIPRISKEEVRAMAGNPDVVIVDCRPEEQWKSSDQKLPGAVHEDPLHVKSWAEKYSKDKTIIIY
jgi:hypothetical protein